VLAGGQSLLPLLNMRLAAPMYLVDINRIAELDYIEARDGYIAIGSITRHRQVEQSTLIQQQHPLLVNVVQHIGHTQIRNRGTIAGSIVHAGFMNAHTILLLLLSWWALVRAPRRLLLLAAAHSPHC